MAPLERAVLHPNSGTISTPPHSLWVFFRRKTRWNKSASDLNSINHNWYDSSISQHLFSHHWTYSTVQEPEEANLFPDCPVPGPTFHSNPSLVHVSFLQKRVGSWTWQNRHIILIQKWTSHHFSVHLAQIHSATEKHFVHILPRSDDPISIHRHSGLHPHPVPDLHSICRCSSFSA